MKQPKQKTVKAGRPSATSREAIIACAIELIKAEGENGLSFRKIGARLGVSPPSLYSYFSDKQAIMAALSEKLFDTGALQFRPGTGARKKIEKLLDVIRQGLLDNGQLLFLLNKSLPAEAMLTVVKTLGTLIEENGISHGKAVRHAQSLLWMTLGFAMFEHNAREAYVVNRFTSIDNLDSDLLQHLDLDNHDRLWRETVKRNLDGISRS